MLRCVGWAGPTTDTGEHNWGFWQRRQRPPSFAWIHGPTHLVFLASPLVSLSGTSLGCFSNPAGTLCSTRLYLLVSLLQLPWIISSFQFLHPLKISNSSSTHVTTSWASLVVPLAGPNQGLPPTAAPRHSWPLPSCSLPRLRAQGPLCGWCLQAGAEGSEVRWPRCAASDSLCSPRTS